MFFCITLAFFIALFMHDIWIRNINVYHTILEIICVFIALSVFVSVWYNYERNSMNNVILAFGFLIVAVFDSLHTLYFLRLDLGTESYFDLSTRFWVLGRLAQGIVLFLFVRSFKGKLNKWTGLVVAALLSLGVSYFTTVKHEYLPVLLTNKGVTPIKTFLEYIIIALFILCILELIHKLKYNSTIAYDYIFMSVFLMIPSELCFTFYSSVNSMTWTIGHILKIFSYYFLFKGVFVSTVVYSYEKLEEKHTELVKALEDKNELTESLRDILDALHTAVIMYDHDCKIKYVNKKLEEMFKCERRNLYGKSIIEDFKIFPSGENGRDLIEMVLEGGDTPIKEVRTCRLADGQYKKVSITSSKINGGVIALIMDAKEEQQLSNLNLQTETILNSISSGVLMIDTDRRIILCNNWFADMVGITRNNLIGMHIEDLNKLLNYKGERQAQRALESDLVDKEGEINITTPEGVEKQLSIYVNNIKNVDGEIIGAIAVTTDITEMKKEQMLIRQQEKLALLGQLGAGIVHETRNFLTTIKGRCQLIEAISEDKKIKNYAVKINDDINEVNRIISEFLFLSKPRETCLEEISMLDIFQSIKNIVETSSMVKGIDVNMIISKEERYLLCDEVQIKQVILNIFKNAADAMNDQADPRLDIETGYDDQNNEMFIQIKDNGKGMSEETLKKLGTMFYTTKQTGTGLGLNVCYQIIKEHKGRIEVESKPMQGAAFKIVLPCIEDSDEDEEYIDAI